MEKRFWPFNLFTFVTDFYMSPSHIDSLELVVVFASIKTLIVFTNVMLINKKRKFINAEKEPFHRDFVFDDQTVLIGLLYKCFIDNLSNFPDHLICVCKQDVLDIKAIKFLLRSSFEVNLTSSSSIDLSKLVYLSKLIAYYY